MGLTEPIATERLTLRPAVGSDALQLRELFNHPDVCRHVWDGHPLPADRIEALLLESRRTFATARFGLRTLALTPDTFIGCVGLRWVPGTDRVEMIYALLPHYRGRGLAREALLSLLRTAFVSLRLETVEASTHAANARSVALLEHLGMRYISQETTSVGPLSRYAMDRAAFISSNILPG